jgi:hypothetical protein
MPRTLLITALMICLSCTDSLAQPAPAIRVPLPRVGMPTSSSYAGVTMTPPSGTSGSALGAIHMNLGAPMASIGIGTITACPSSGLPGIMPSSPTNSTTPMSADIASSAASAGTIPVAPVTPAFSPFALSGGCAASLPSSAPPNLDSLTFANAAVPLISTEGATSGMSPLITVPVPSAVTPLTSTGAASSTSTLMTATTSVAAVPLTSTGAVTSDMTLMAAPTYPGIPCEEALAAPPVLPPSPDIDASATFAYSSPAC